MMNERIKQLAEQAGFDEHWFEQHPTGCALPKPLMLKEYTELIVKECVAVIQEELDSGQYSQPVFTGLRVAKNLINNRFGVEE